MGEIRDHGLIEEMKASLAGLLVAFDEVVSGLEEMASEDPAVHGKLAGHLVVARAVMAKAELKAEHVRGVGDEHLRAQRPGNPET
jgi:hypothetical protein